MPARARLVKIRLRVEVGVGVRVRVSLLERQGGEAAAVHVAQLRG